jgi:hypothetical protein
MDNENTVSLEDFEDESELHLWLADIVDDINWEDWDKEDGAKHLVEEAAYRLGTHGEQIVEREN